ncbi:tail fiber domain-containing protein, partial [Flavobacterium sp. F-65]
TMPIAAWGLKGNTGSATDFIGTTNDQDVVFKRNNIRSGSLAGTNTSFGQHSLESNSSSNGNSAFGLRALQNNTVGNNNTAIGTMALQRSINNIDNVAVGLAALGRLEKGNYNVALGSNALFLNKAGNYNIAIGYMAGDELFMQDNQDAFNIVIGSKAGKGLVQGIKNTILGSNIIGLPANLSNSIIIGEGAKTSVNNSIRLGNTSISSFTGQVAYSFASDKRYKTDIKTIPLGLDFINKLNPVEYIRKNNTSNTKEWGFIAQELQQTLQEENYKDAGIVQDDGSADKMLSVRYTDLIAPMVKAMQELTEHNEFLNNRINQLEAKLEKLSK